MLVLSEPKTCKQLVAGETVKVGHQSPVMKHGYEKESQRHMSKSMWAKESI